MRVGNMAPWFSEHHHVYSRTKMLDNVGGDNGTEAIEVSKNQNIIEKGQIMSITVGMGRYSGKYKENFADDVYGGVCWKSSV